MPTQPVRPAHRRARPGALHRTLLLPLLLVLALLGLTSCSASSMGPGDSDGGAIGQDSRDVAQVGSEAADAGGDDAAARPDPVDGLTGDGTVSLDGDDPLMVRSVELEVLVEDVLAAVSRARAAATATGGWVSTEEVRPGDEDRPGYATLVLRIPSADLDAVVTSLGELGEVTSSRSSAQDVTTEYRDVEARVATLEASAERLRDLVGEATGIEAIAALERELADREAELDALKARMKVLAEDVSRSTITLYLAEDSESLAEAVPPTGFVAGLQQGWAAFASSVTVLLTALGAVLPFLLAAAVLALPLLAWRRRRARTSTTPVPAGDG